MKVMNIHALPALTDNYIWAIELGNKLTIIDPGEGQPVLDFLGKYALELESILITHHHYDHIGGIADLYTHNPQVNIYGPDLTNHRFIKAHSAAAIASLADIPIRPVHSQSKLHLAHGQTWHILCTPGHTQDHICYYLPGHLFCADTLFSAGCGRLFDGTAAQMYQSLNKLAQLPDDTKIYPAHEYTLNNLAFAAYIEPNNLAIQQAMSEAQQQQARQQPTLPSTLAREKCINPFLRCDQATVHARVVSLTGQLLDTPSDVFKALRTLKDHYS